VVNNNKLKNVILNERKHLHDLRFNDVSITLKERVKLFLEKFNNAKPKEICACLSISYVLYGNTVKTYKCKWKKSNPKNRQALKLLKFHNVRFLGLCS